MFGGISTQMGINRKKEDTRTPIRRKEMKKALCLILALVMALSMVACSKPAETTAPAGTTATKATEATKATTAPTKATEATLATAIETQEMTKDEAKTYKKEITLAVSNDFNRIDPQYTSGTGHDVLYKMVFNQMVHVNLVTLEIEPELAKSWEYLDPQTIKFTLRDDVTFSNGHKMTSASVKYSWSDERRETTKETGQTSNLDHIDNFTIIDDYTFTIHLDVADGDFVQRMGGLPYSIFDEEAVKADYETGVMIGTGGWKIDSFEANTKCVMSRVDDSWVWKETGVTPTEKVTFNYIKEAGTLSAAVQTGEIAVYTGVGLTTLDKLKPVETLEYATYDAQTLYYLFFNWLSPILGSDDEAAKNFRKAIAFAINYDDLIELAYQGLATRAYSMWGRSQFGLVEDYGEETIVYNLDKAKEYLAKSKYPNGTKITALTTSGYKARFELIQVMLREIGVELDIQETDTNGVTAAVKEAKNGNSTYDICAYSISLNPTGDRMDFTAKPESPTNRGNYDNEKVRDLYAKYKPLTDEAERLAVLKEIQDIMNDACVYVGMNYGVTSAVWNKGVSGVNYEVDGKTDYTHIMWAEN